MDHLRFIEIFLRLFLATILGGLIGWERETKGRSAGLRTHILVSVGSALITLTMLYLHQVYAPDSDLDTKIAAAIVAGIGFLGGGTIIKSEENIHGMTTAASIWINAGVGMAVGCGFFSGAIIATLIILFTLTVLIKMEDSGRKR